MQIQPLKNYLLNNFRQNQTKETPKAENHQTFDRTELPRGFYVPFCANHDKNGVLKLNEAEKLELVKLFKIPHFRTAVDGTPKEDIKRLAVLSYKYKGILTEILKGNYIAVFDNPKETRPIFDLEELAKHNKRHLESPKNLYEEVQADNLTLSLMNVIQKEDLLPFDGNKILINTEEQKLGKQDSKYKQFETKIIYKKHELYDKIFKEDEQSKKLSEKQVDKLYKQSTPDNANKILKSSAYTPEFREKLIELLDIPYFPAAISNLKEDDISLLVNYIIDEEPLMSLILNRGVQVIDRTTKDQRPLFDLEKFAKYNLAHPDNPKDLFTEMQDNVLLQSVINETTSNTPIPFAFILPSFHEKSLNPNFLEEGDDLNECLFNLNKEHPKYDFPYFITFNKDLNIVEKPEEKSDAKAAPKVRREKFKPMPDSIKEIFHSDKLSTSEKKSLFELGEIPHFYECLKGASIEEVRNLILFHKLYKENFENLLKGNFSINYDKSDDPKTTNYVEESILSLRKQCLLNKKHPEKKSKLLSKITHDSFGLTVMEEKQKYDLTVSGKISYIIYTKKDNDSVNVQVCYLKGGKEALKSTTVPFEKLPYELIQELLDIKNHSFVIYFEPPKNK